MAYSIEPISANCYPGTSILINKFDIRDKATLNEVEGTLTAAKSAQWLNMPERNTFDFEHYKAIHQFLFSDLYAWAGQIRDVKELPFAPPKRSLSRQTESSHTSRGKTFYAG